MTGGGGGGGRVAGARWRGKGPDGAMVVGLYFCNCEALRWVLLQMLEWGVGTGGRG